MLMEAANKYSAYPQVGKPGKRGKGCKGCTISDGEKTQEDHSKKICGECSNYRKDCTCPKKGDKK